MKGLAVLGSTGSIGCNVLEVVRRFPGRFRLCGLSAGRNIRLLARQVVEFEPDWVSVAEPALLSELAALLPSSYRGRLLAGQEGNCRLATLDQCDTVVTAMVGAVGLVPTLAAIEAGKDIALANKETLVMAGRLVMEAARTNGIRLLPIDSEHSAIMQALDAGRRADLDRLILTASGGPCRQLPLDQLALITPDQALAHPNWQMGRKISIDSATLMNKGLEVIEARWLFDVAPDRIQVLVHPQSIVHSMVEFIDGSVIAQLGIADMRIPIAYALSYPERLPLDLPRLNVRSCGDLHFEDPDLVRFPALGLAFSTLEQGGVQPTVLNASNEVAVAAFLDGKLGFLGIGEVVSQVLTQCPAGSDTDLQDILAADTLARQQAHHLIAKGL